MTHVLVVDDEPHILRTIDVNLAARGYAVDAAASGEEALRLAAASPPDAVVVDLGLPGIDGLAVVRVLRQSSSVPILVVSARDTETDKVDALSAGADDYLAKPFAIDELLRRLKRLLADRSGGPTGSVSRA